MSGMSLYTVVADYKGGTYCAQVKAPNASEAMKEWVRRIPSDAVLFAQFTEHGIRDLERIDWDEDRPQLLDKLVNVWCTTATVNNALCLVNIIHTLPK